MKDYLRILFTALSVFPGVDLRTDDKYTAVLEKELEYVKMRTYDIVYPAFKARQLIPVSNEADTGAETITYRQWDGFGIAQMISNYADDIAMVEVLAEEFTQKVQGFALGYSFSIQELRRAAMSGTNLPENKARWTRRGFEQKVENIAALGDSAGGLYGLANNPNVTVISPLYGDWFNAARTGAEMVADLLHLESQIVTLNGETFEPNILALDISLYNRLNSVRISTTGDTNTTALQAFLASASYVQEVVSWNKLKEANATEDGPRAVCYARDPDVVEMEIPQEFEQLAPQQRNLAFTVPTHGRNAGVVWRYPIGGAYMDGLKA